VIHVGCGGTLDVLAFLILLLFQLVMFARNAKVVTQSLNLVGIVKMRRLVLVLVLLPVVALEMACKCLLMFRLGID
jgi:hypothetical protein